MWRKGEGDEKRSTGEKRVMKPTMHRKEVKKREKGRRRGCRGEAEEGDRWRWEEDLM